MKKLKVTMRSVTHPTITIAFQTDKALAAYGPLAQQVEAYGFDGITVYNDMLFQPAWLPLLEIARATNTLTIGVAAVNPFTCHPINIAGNIALIDEAAQGRAYLGLARGGWLDFVGVEPKRTVTALREAFHCVRHLLRQSKEPLSGEFYPLAGGDALRWPVLRSEIPFLLGSWGASTIRACADQIHEIKIGGSANPAVIPHFQQILTDTPRNIADDAPIDICIGAVCVVDEDGSAARAHVKREVALYLPVVAELDPTVNLEPELLTRLKEAAARYDFDGAANLISDELLKCFAFAGTPDEIADHAAALFAAGATRVEFGTPHGLTTEAGLHLL
ncbi:MAG TPA: LLM class flavin-dependent oxidoreductase, partial [Caldilineaceae bacterium]|nr:LLM class flavin-dependent oxidoreductase [Caldilineaceae bacterium]